eukprot:jgi/Tetstr1/443198/TSEL_031238.t1
MGACCGHDHGTFEGLSDDYKRRLWAVIAINAGMFAVEMIAALAKGFSLLAMGLWVFGSTLYQLFVLGVPQAQVMGAIGFLALAANLASVGLLMRYKDGDANIIVQAWRERRADKAACAVAGDAPGHEHGQETPAT